jgi:HlyD family secretion protein
MAATKKFSWGRWLTLIIIVAAGVGSWWWFVKRPEEIVFNFRAVPVTRGDLTQTVTATGTLNPVVNVTVGSQVSGRISKLNVDFNSIVKSNEVIAEIDPSTYQAAVEMAEANLANARANLELQQVEAKRSASLFTNKLISASDYDTAIATLHEAEASVKIQEASLSNAEANLGYCKILSPVDGVVISRAVELGQTVASSFSTPTLFQIANDLTKMVIDTAVDEADIGGVKQGQEVEFTVDAFPNRIFYGTVTQVRNAPTNVNNVITYDTVIGVTNTDYSLKPGMTASVSIITAQRNQVLEIPNTALLFHPPDMAVVKTNATARIRNPNNNDGEQAGSRREPRGNRDEHGAAKRSPMHTVYLLCKDATGKGSTLKAVEIKTGITDNINTEVLSGLKEGDQVVTGVAIPGLNTEPGANNPFAPRRRF